jgi:glutathione-regulated potassium-efflux system ancillary protein KefC
LLLGLFFISVGASINFNLLLESPFLIAGFLLLMVFLKFGILFMLGRFFGLKGGQNTLFSFSLAQGGEFAFVLIAFSSQNSVLTEELSGILLLVVALSMAFTPLLLLINEKLIQPMVIKSENVRDHDEIDDKDNPVIIAGFGRFGVVVGRLLIANGFKATILDNDPDHIEVLKKFGFKVYYGDATRPDLLHAAGCENAKVLVIAIDDKQKSLQIVDFVTRTYPNLNIIGRATSMQHAYEYLKRDIVDFNLDTLESSLQVGVKALTKLGFTRNQASRAAKIFKYYDEEVMHKLFEHYEEDEKKYLSEAKRLADDLEELFRTEKAEPIHDIDCAWDVTTLREEAREVYAEMEKRKE